MSAEITSVKSKTFLVNPVKIPAVYVWLTTVHQHSFASFSWSSVNGFSRAGGFYQGRKFALTTLTGLFLEVFFVVHTTTLEAAVVVVCIYPLRSYP